MSQKSLRKIYEVGSFHTWTRLFSNRVFLAILFVGSFSLAAPQLHKAIGSQAPSFWDPNRTIERPDLSAVRQIRFLTEDDFPPFNFQLPDGQLAGFNIELARAICAELDVPCTIQRRNWDLLTSSINDNSGDAVIASIAINAETQIGRAHV